MAEGFARALSHRAIDAESAGTNPKPIHPLAVRVMAERDIDISSQKSKALDAMIEKQFDYVITVCDRARESCPTWPSAREHIHWSFDDPAEATGDEAQKLAVFRRVRDEIARRVQLFVLAHRGLV
jgi:arsenate reductase